MPIPSWRAGLDGELELGADAVGGGDEQRVLEAARLEVEQAAEPADAAQRPVRAVLAASGPIAFTRALPASISTPASR